MARLEQKWGFVRPVRGKLHADSPSELLASHRSLQRFVVDARAKSREQQPVLLEFKKCKRLDSTALLLLMYATKQLGSWGRHLWFRGFSGDPVWETLVRNLEHHKSGQSGPISPTPGEYLLRRIPSASEMVQALEDWSDMVAAEIQVSEETVARWKMLVAETTTNGFQHGLPQQMKLPGIMPPTSSMLVAGHVETGRHLAQLAVLDFGSGIPTVIRPAAPRRLVGLDGQLIRHATQRGVTSQSVQDNQGAGLADLVAAVKRNGGMLYILSGNGMFAVAGGREYVRELRPAGYPWHGVMHGTLTVIRLAL